MCGDCAPTGGWGRRRFLAGAAVAALGASAPPALGAPARARSATGGSPAPPPILPRRAWAGTDAAAAPVPPEPEVRFLVVHHTVNANDYGDDDVPGLLRRIHRFHTGPEKGWPDIAYNFVVDRFGRTWEARAGSLEGGVAGDATGGNQGFDQKCAFLGDHRVEPPSPAAQAAMAALLAMLADRHGIDTAPGATTAFVSRGSNRHPAGAQVRTATITGHRTMSVTACPGDAAMALVHDVLPAAVTARRAPAPTTSVPSTTAPATAPTPTAAAEPRPTGASEPSGATPGTPVSDPLPWLVGGGAVAVVAGAVLRLRGR